MSRGTTSAMNAEATASSLTPIFLAQFDYDSGILYAWNGIGDLVWNGDTYLGVGHLIGMGEMTETLDMQAVGTSFQLNGIPQSRISQVLGEHYQGRPAKVWLGALDSTGQIVADPVLVFEGRMDTLDIDDSDETSTITQNVESELIDLRRARTIRYTDEEQKAQYPQDKGLEFVAGLKDQVIKWGR